MKRRTERQRRKVFEKGRRRTERRRRKEEDARAYERRRRLRAGRKWWPKTKDGVYIENFKPMVLQPKKMILK